MASKEERIAELRQAYANVFAKNPNMSPSMRIMLSQTREARITEIENEEEE